MAAFLYCVVGLLVLAAGGATLAAGAWEIGTALIVLGLFFIYIASRFDKKGSS